jgi:hypothetical protein
MTEEKAVCPKSILREKYIVSSDLGLMWQSGKITLVNDKAQIRE